MTQDGISKRYVLIMNMVVTTGILPVPGDNRTLHVN